MSDLVNHKNKSFRNILKMIGPNTDPFVVTCEKDEFQTYYKYYLFSRYFFYFSGK